MTDPIEIIKPTPVDFSGGKLDADTRQAKAGTLASVRSCIVGMDVGDYEVILMPAGECPYPGTQILAKFRLETPPKGMVNNVMVRAHVSHAGKAAEVKDGEL